MLLAYRSANSSLFTESATGCGGWNYVYGQYVTNVWSDTKSPEVDHRSLQLRFTLAKCNSLPELFVVHQSLVWTTANKAVYYHWSSVFEMCHQ
eukprot:6174410-Pleurochrysis_carterae.AAC.3